MYFPSVVHIGIVEFFIICSDKDKNYYNEKEYSMYTFF